ncbi:Family T1, proteasome alpha subunit, threonine peptidase [Trichomonas vaginalis G3]|uniref:Proteasome subunit alpha type n=1 Tax=Trichomonas vaginalis (strain ATCC PRA-98 / G3) TaxID=412133 RepID=A2FT79_TRIV3|nr:threonine-type endopeptidase protein [Trichomonas vaginalis G3]EAX91890.1 Family T1, proteasome alpha subunit, threonine peptidase [Trichomonas vaginalis G3]KAI5518550.1 threonine-type endopeptidase protein [Trichomonas vaginalis G3]|eukprot:XP_001304820.1 Family T1, proteasome alpha subunit, threonine peptidase [Trichomonas vaginalis G3]
MTYRYDAGTTTFSSDGRILQVEYAIQSINQAGTAIGVQFTNGVVLAAEKKNTGRLVDYLFPEKMAKIDGHIVTAVAGLTADANTLVDLMRTSAQKYLKTYDEQMPVEQLVRMVCDEKHSYTQYGGLRPYGVSFLIAGYDRHKGCQLYLTDPSGNFGGWKATAIGENNQTAQSILKSQYKDNMTATEAMDLTVKVLCKTLDSTSLSADKLEFAVLQFREEYGPKVRILTTSEVDTLMKRYEETIKKSAEEKE